MTKTEVTTFLKSKKKIKEGIKIRFYYGNEPVGYAWYSVMGDYWVINVGVRHVGNTNMVLDYIRRSDGTIKYIIEQGEEFGGENI